MSETCNGVPPIQDIFCSGQKGFELDSNFGCGIPGLDQLPSPLPLSTPKNKQIEKVATPSSSSSSRTPVRFMESFPKSDILQGCNAFVDVWSNNGLANRSAVFMKMLEKMGAKVEKKFTRDKAITHLVFKDGHKLYLKKAKARDVKIVNIEWVDRCREKQCWVKEDVFLFDDTDYKPPKKFREMQPISFEETQQKTEQKVKNFFEKEKQRKADMDRKFEEIIFNHSKSKEGSGMKSPDRNRVIVSDTPHVAVHSPHRFFYPHLIAETPNLVLEQRLERVKQGKPVFSPPTSASDEDADPSDYQRRKISPRSRRHRRERSSISRRSPIISNVRLEALKEDDSDVPQSSQESSFKALHINNKKSTDESTEVADTLNTASSIETSSDMDLTCDNFRPIYDARNNLVSQKDISMRNSNSEEQMNSSPVDDGGGGDVNTVYASDTNKSDSSTFTLHLSNTEDEDSTAGNHKRFDDKKYQQKKDTSLQSEVTSSVDTSKNSVFAAADSPFKIPSSPAITSSQSSVASSTTKKKKQQRPRYDDVIVAKMNSKLTIDSGKKAAGKEVKKTSSTRGKKFVRKAVRRLCDEIQGPATSLMHSSHTDTDDDRDPLISTPVQNTARKRRRSSFVFAFNPIVVNHDKLKAIETVSTSLTTISSSPSAPTASQASTTASQASSTATSQTSSTASQESLILGTKLPSSSSQSSQDDPSYKSSSKKTPHRTDSPPSFTTKRITRASIGTAKRKEQILAELTTDEPKPPTPSRPTTTETTEPFHISTPERIKTNPRKSAIRSSYTSTPIRTKKTTTPTRKKTTAQNKTNKSRATIKTEDDCRDYFDGFEEEEERLLRSSFVEKLVESNYKSSKHQKAAPSTADTSLEDFISPRSSKAKQRAYYIAKKHSIALTGMDHAKRKEVGEMIRSLGGTVVNKLAYANEATHVVTGDGRRTVNIYFAICRGLWIVSSDWILDSRKNGEWLSCSSYEKNYPAGVTNRTFRNKLPPHERANWYQQVFEGIKIFVSQHTRPEPETFKTLIHYCGGILRSDPQQANICIASSTVPPSDIVWVTGKWVYDSIYHGEVQMIEDYQL